MQYFIPTKKEDIMTRKKPDWFTIKEAADYLGVGEPTIYRWMRENKMTYRKIGDSTRFLQSDLESMVQVFHSKEDVGNVHNYCPCCKSEDLIEGELRSTGLVYFQPKKTKFWTLSDSNVKVSSQICTTCGNIITKGDTEKLAALLEENKKENEE